MGIFTGRGFDEELNDATSLKEACQCRPAAGRTSKE
jgi:hypothetical protein